MLAVVLELDGRHLLRCSPSSPAAARHRASPGSPLCLRETRALDAAARATSLHFADLAQLLLGMTVHAAATPITITCHLAVPKMSPSSARFYLPRLLTLARQEPITRGTLPNDGHSHALLRAAVGVRTVLHSVRNHRKGHNIRNEKCVCERRASISTIMTHPGHNGERLTQHSTRLVIRRSNCC